VTSSSLFLAAGIDAGMVQRAFGNDVALFKSLLVRMARDFADLALPVSLDDQGSRDKLMARVHQLKGSAGMLGATRVSRFAGAAESALQQDRTLAVVEKSLQQLASALTALGDDAVSLLEGELDPTPDATTATGNGDDSGNLVAESSELRPGRCAGRVP